MQKALVCGSQLWLQMRIAYSFLEMEKFSAPDSSIQFLAMTLLLLLGALRHLFPYLLNLGNHPPYLNRI